MIVESTKTWVAFEPGVGLSDGFGVDLANSLRSQVHIARDRFSGFPPSDAEEDVPVTLGQDLVCHETNRDQALVLEDPIDDLLGEGLASCVGDLIGDALALRAL